MKKYKNMFSDLNKLILVFLSIFIFIQEGHSQTYADPGIGILMSPASVKRGSTGILSATVGNDGNHTIVKNSLRVTITVGSKAEIIGIAPGSDTRWSQLSLTTGSANTINLTNTVGGFVSFDVGDILLTVRGNAVSDPELILGNIVYITAQNPELCGGCASPPYNASQGNASSLNDNSQTSLATYAPIIDAVVDTTVAINGLIGGITNALTLNDSINGTVVVIGTAPGNVTLTGLIVPAGLTLNGDGTVTIDSNTLAGNYSLTYKICGVNHPTNCDSVTSIIVVFRELPDLSPTLDIDALVFPLAGPARDFVINIGEVRGAPSDGQVVVKISKGNAFLITYSDSTSNSNGTPVNNSAWVITENASFITITLKAGAKISANTFSAIGFKIVRKPGVPTKTSQPITVTIVNGTGSDSQNSNNAYSTIINAE
jgi:hypothetical protein